MAEGEGTPAAAGAASPPAAVRASRLQRRVEALTRRRQEPEPIRPLKLLNTDELRRALALVERAGVLPSGEVLRPEVFRAAPPEEWAALERWVALCGEPLDHLDAAEELLDRMGDAYGWRSREAAEAALLLARLEYCDASPWLVGKRAEAVVSFYDELEHHRGGSPHARVRGAIKRLERLQGMALLDDGRASPP